MKKSLLIVIVAIATGAGLVTAAEVENSAYHRPEGTRLEIIGGDVDLPAEGIWEVVSEQRLQNAARVYLIPDQAVYEQFTGERVAAVERNRAVKMGRYPVQSLVWPCLEYAKEHDGQGPSSIVDLEQKTSAHLTEVINRAPWSGSRDGDSDGPFACLIPDVEFRFEEARQFVRREDRAPLSLELKPYVDDGQHWVCFTDQSCERVDIDQELIKQLGLTIHAVHTIDDVLTPSPPSELKYRLVGLRPENDQTALEINLRNVLTEERLDVTWDSSAAAEGGEALTKDLKTARVAVWQPYWQASGSTVLHSWLQSFDRGFANFSTRPAGAQTSIFSVMGGRAAVRETLQMQNIRADRNNNDQVIDVFSIQGVEVASHPFEEMLEERTQIEIRLANLAPRDRFFVLVNKPKTISALLDEGADFLSNIGGAASQNNITYDLKNRYLARLGLSEQWVELVLDSGVIEQCALLTPDLFFIDGTDLTLVMKLSQPQLIAPLLRLAGVPGLQQGAAVKIELASGRSVFWAMRDDFLTLSTSKTELDQVLDLHAADGAGSLGESAEFRYMLSQLPLRSETRAYAYFSDPFIRRLVGPETKIGQLRRMRAKADMERITAAALLARADGFENPAALEDLVEHGYLSSLSLAKDYHLDDELRARSSRYGTLADPVTLAENRVRKVSQTEAEGYRTYVDNYSRFWRQFFDPIAVRIDDADGGFLEATTFILPLLDSSIYNSLREVIVSREEGTPMKLPRLSEDAVFQLAVNLKEPSWQKIADGLAKMIGRYTSISPAIMDDFGPSLHLAVHDSDPVIALGSGDIIGAFGGNAMGLTAGREMMFIPLGLSLLTRPCTLAIETGDADSTLRYLRQVSNAALRGRTRRRGEMSVDFYKVKGKDSWVYSLDVLGLLKLRYGIEVRDDFLLIRNIPWSTEGNVVGSERAELNGARIAVGPEACDLLLPSLFAAASEHQSSAALGGAALLYPLLESGYATIGEAAEAHMKLFGFRPVHPPGGTWLWDGRTLYSSSYGSVSGKEQPPHEEGNTDFGLMRTIEELSVEMQFEDSGLRSKARWKMR